jgi:ABC-type transport system involved in multi-copper enzyme maturation permease subunit
MKGMIRDCVMELLDRRVVYVYAVITVIAVMGTVGSSLMEIRFQGVGVEADQMNRALGNPLMMGHSMYMYVLIFLSVMATAGLIPRMLARGSADFYLSKPMSRAQLLLSKVFAVWLVYGSAMVLSFLVNYIVSAAVFGLFSFRILYIIALDLLALLIWLSVTAFAGIVTGSSSLAMMAAFLVWLTQKILHYHDFPKRFIDSKVVTYLIDGLYYVFPKTGEISDLVNELASGGASSWMPLYTSLLFAAVLMFVTVLIFRKKDY